MSQTEKYANIEDQRLQIYFGIWHSLNTGAPSLSNSTSTKTMRQKVITVVEEIVDGQVVSTKETVTNKWAGAAGGASTASALKSEATINTSRYIKPMTVTVDLILKSDVSLTAATRGYCCIEQDHRPRCMWIEKAESDKN